MFAFMAEFFDSFDRLAGIKATANWLDRVAFAFLVLLAISAPHSIAATQTAWLAGMLLTVIRLIIGPREKFRFGLIDYALWGLFLWTAVSAVMSYDQPTSLNKLRAAGVFLIVYFVRLNIRNLRAAAFVGTMLVVSCMVNVLWVPIERAIGRGVEIHEIDPNGPLAKALLMNGDALLTANKRRLQSPDDLLAVLETSETTEVKFYRPDFEFTVKLDRNNLLPGDTAIARLGIGWWKKSHNWRSRGFYGHYVTYAEVLQLIGSLAFGLLIASFVGWRKRTAKPWQVGALAACFALFAFALLLTVTRAPQLALMMSAGVIVLVGLGRKWVLIAALVCIPIAAGGLYFLQQSRDVGFFDAKDESTRYRKVMIQDGLRLMTESPRNLVFGLGVDSIKKHWREWGMFEDGNLPMGHFHSTPLQLAVERGFPALLIWLVLMVAYLRSLWRSVRRSDRSPDWRVYGILLGSLGGTIGFLASSIVHYNFGDQEVVMTFYLLMGISLAIIAETRSPTDVET
jgi:Lipid A core - O-antigen ligase and related enzymes